MHSGERLIGRRIIEVGRVGSSMDVAAGLAYAGAEEGTVVVAEEQTSGRGRRGNKWLSPPGVNLYISIILRPDTQVERSQGLAFLGAVGMAKFLQSAFDLDANLKWPNDVLVGNRKIAGIIGETLLKQDGPPATMEAAILGIGLNINWVEIPSEIRDEATSIALELTQMVDKRLCLEGLLAALDEEYTAYNSSGALGPILEQWRKLDCTLGRRVVMLQEDGSTLEGTATDITPYGALIIQTTTGERRVAHAGEVNIVEFGG